MKTIGLLGGMSWESTAIYYKIINEEIRRCLGGLHSAELVLYSLDFAHISALQQAGNWSEATKILQRAAKKLSSLGAECLVICTNTMHKIADNISASIPIPLLHIADTTALRIKSQGIQNIGLLGTRYTMEQDFYRGRLSTHGLTVITPSSHDREIVHKVIYDELCQGIISDNSRKEYQRIIHLLITQGAEAVILGCTEIGLLITEADCSVPLFDTTRIHAEAAVEFALKA